MRKVYSVDSIRTLERTITSEIYEYVTSHVLPSGIFNYSDVDMLVEYSIVQVIYCDIRYKQYH